MFTHPGHPGVIPATSDVVAGVENADIYRTGWFRRGSAHEVIVAIDRPGVVRAHSRGAASTTQTQGLDAAVTVVGSLVTDVL